MNKDSKTVSSKIPPKIIPNTIYIGERSLVRMGENRWLVYLPVELNDLWEYIKNSGKKVRVYIEILDEK